MKYRELREQVWRANRALVDTGLATLTWGNASAVDRETGIIGIKPSGVDYAKLQPEHIVLLSLETGATVDSELRPSSDAPTHLFLYQGFASVGGVVHTHSSHATSWAQAGKPLPCFGTTHADHFYGPVPVARPLTQDEVAVDYEHNTGVSIVETFQSSGIHPLHVPAVLLPGHAPFTWGLTVEDALNNAIALEAASRMALETLCVDPQAVGLPDHLLEKHFHRKHGSGAYYGQTRD